MPALSPKTTQGPAWLAELLFAPGSVVRSGLSLLALCVAVIVGWKLYQEGVPDAETQHQMGSILATAIATATGTIALASTGTFGYLLDVAAGVVLGAGVVIVGERVGRWIFQRWVTQRRSSTAWLSLASLLWVPLAIVPPGARASLLISMVQGGLVAAVGMAALTAQQDL